MVRLPVIDFHNFFIEPEKKEKKREKKTFLLENHNRVIKDQESILILFLKIRSL